MRPLERSRTWDNEMEGQVVASVKRGKALVASLRAQAGVRDPEALAAWLGRYKKFRKSGLKPEQAKKAAGGDSGSGGVPQSVTRAEASIAGNNYETGIVFDTDGKELWRSGKDDLDHRAHVPVDDEATKAIRGNIFTHNHPGQAQMSFSAGDFGSMWVTKPKELRAVTEAYLYRLTPKDGAEQGQRTSADLPFNPSTAYSEELERLYNETPAGEVDAADLTHRVSQKIARLYGFDYRRERRKKKSPPVLSPR